MDDETMAKIFQTFYSTKRGGSGLGLPTTRKIIEGHGGLIYVQSEIGRRHAIYDRTSRTGDELRRTVASEVSG